MLSFVYGTLTDPDQVEELLEEWAFVGAAILDGLHRVDGEYPTLSPGGSVEGRLLWTNQVDRLDAYEGVDRGLYVRVAVPLTGPGDGGDRRDDGEAAVYVGDPARLGVPDRWPGVGSFEERVLDYVEASDVIVRRVGDRQH